MSWGSIPSNKGITFNELYNVVYSENRIKRIRNFSSSNKAVIRSEFHYNCLANFTSSYTDNRVITKGSGSYIGGNIGITDIDAIFTFKQSNGKIIVGNRTPFRAGGYLYGSLIRFNADGTLDTSFSNNNVLSLLINGVFNSKKPYDIVELSNGNLIVVGDDFEQISGDETQSPPYYFNIPRGFVCMDSNGNPLLGNPINNLKGINGRQGSPDFSRGGRQAPMIRTVIADNDYIYIGGDFEGITNSTGTTFIRWRIARIKISDGTVPAFTNNYKGFSASDTNGPFAKVCKIAFRSDGVGIYVGGYFDEYHTVVGTVTQTSNFTCIDKSSGDINSLFSNIRFPQITDLKNEVTDFAVNPFGQIYVAGYFPQIRDQANNITYSRNGIATILNNGNIQHPFNQASVSSTGVINTAINLIGNFGVLVLSNWNFDPVTGIPVNLMYYDGTNGTVLNSNIGFNSSSPNSTTYIQKNLPRTSFIIPNSSGGDGSLFISQKDHILAYDSNNFYLSVYGNGRTVNKGDAIDLYATRFLKSFKIDSSGNVDKLW